MDDLLARYRASDGIAWYLTDHLGTVRDVVNSSGVLINTIDYDSFGNILSESSPSVGDRYKFTGREYNSTTGLYYYRARIYDLGTGVFLSQDTISFNSGDTNLYRYVFNSPTNTTDPTGLTAQFSLATLFRYTFLSAFSLFFFKQCDDAMMKMGAPGNDGRIGCALFAIFIFVAGRALFVPGGPPIPPPGGGSPIA